MEKENPECIVHIIKTSSKKKRPLARVKKRCQQIVTDPMMMRAVFLPFLLPN